METELSIVEQIVLEVFETHGQPVKAAELGSMTLTHIFSTHEHSLTGRLQMLPETGLSDRVVDAIYSLIAKNRIIEIEYPDASIPDRVKSFLLPKSTHRIRVNGLALFAWQKTDTGFEVDFKPQLAWQRDVRSC